MKIKTKLNVPWCLSFHSHIRFDDGKSNGQTKNDKNELI